MMSWVKKHVVNTHLNVVDKTVNSEILKVPASLLITSFKQLHVAARFVIEISFN